MSRSRYMGSPASQKINALNPSIKLNDETLFGNDAAEQENADVLAGYFINKDAFAPFWDENRALSIARSRKGMGKSAVLRQVKHVVECREPNSVVINVDGSDLSAMGDFSSSDYSVLINEWMKAISSRIVREIGARMNFAFTDSAMHAVEAAELAGFKDRNIFRALYDRCAKAAKVEGLERIENSDAALLKNNADQFCAQPVWVLIDDIDARFEQTPYNVNKVASFLAACRKLIRDVSGLRLRVTIRSDVWSSIDHVEDTDKIEQYMIDLKWSRSEMGVMLAKRVLAYVRRAGLAEYSQMDERKNTDYLVGLVFQGRLPWDGSMVPPTQVVNILAAKRPRWLCQLCRLAGAQATIFNDHTGESLGIGMNSIQAVMPQFGRYRLSDLYKEHGHQLNVEEMKKLVYAFEGGWRQYDTLTLTKVIFDRYLGLMAPDARPQLERRIVREPIDLAQFLFRIGFFEAIDRDREGSFIDFEMRPELLCSRQALRDDYIWSIHPAYRSVLSIH